MPTIKKYARYKLLKTRKAIVKRKATVTIDWSTCACGNDAMLSGLYYATDKTGTLDAGFYTTKHQAKWKPKFLCCNECSAIFNASYNERKDWLQVRKSILSFATKENHSYALEVQGYGTVEEYEAKSNTKSKGKK